jgi:hypothetical protein
MEIIWILFWVDSFIEDDSDILVFSIFTAKSLKMKAMRFSTT